MRKKLSAYWWCQLAGWGLFVLIAAFFYLAVPRFTGFTDFLSIITTAALGLFTSHLMRLVIIRTKLLDLRLWKQFISIFLVTFIFSFVYLVFGWVIEILRGFRPEYNFWNEVVFGVFLNSQFLFTWNLIYFSYHYIEKSRKQKLEKIQLENQLKFQQLESVAMKAQLQQQATELEMQVLRAQMNPHFIFNSLNAINRFILQSNKAQASEYLTKFSRLIRLILQNSQEALIPLESELQSLQLYLELEVLRFDNLFEYKVQVNDDVDVSMIKVPPLFIQPYAENAIWHGLMHREEKGHLEIELFAESDMLCCRIADDGVGRKRAGELKSKSAYSYKSMGMRITADRIAMLQKQTQLKSSIEVTDLMLPDGDAGGTEVIIKIPLNYD